MFSLKKVLLLILILAAVWYGFKLIGRLDRARRNKLRAQAGSGSRQRHDPDEPIELSRSEDGKSFVAGNHRPDQ